MRSAESANTTPTFYNDSTCAKVGKNESLPEGEERQRKFESAVNLLAALSSEEDCADGAVKWLVSSQRRHDDEDSPRPRDDPVKARESAVVKAAARLSVKGQASAGS